MNEWLQTGFRIVKGYQDIRSQISGQGSDRTRYVTGDAQTLIIIIRRNNHTPHILLVSSVNNGQADKTRN